MSYPSLKVKAGRFTFDPQSKKVRVSKDKGFLSLYTNTDLENHVSWVNTDTNMEELDLIVFPFDAIFEGVNGQKNTFVLRFQSNDDKFFFYLQQKMDPQEFVTKVRQRIAFVPPEEMEAEEKQPQKQKPQKMEVEEPSKQETRPPAKGFSQQFLNRLTNNLMAAAKKDQNQITHLSKVLTAETIGQLLSQLKEQDKSSLLQYLPEEQRSSEHIASNVRSPQFQQAVDALTDALNSENVFPLFMEMGLDQKYIKSNYGVHAFLLALQQWATRQQKKQN